MNFKKSFKLSSLALATSLAFGAAAMPTTASAEVSADLAVSSMYLWRGLDISGGPAVSGSLGYDFGNGFSVGTWVSSESQYNMEVDLYASYEGSVGDFGYSVGYATYIYPQATDDNGTPDISTDDIPLALSDSDTSEYILGLSYGDLSFTAYINTDSDESDDYKYYSLDYSMGKVGLHYGKTSVGTSADEYSDINVSYAATDNLTWTISKASGDAVDADESLKDPLIMLSYSVPLK